MAPRHDRKPLLASAPSSKAKIGSSSATGNSPFADARALEAIFKSVGGENYVKNTSKKQHSLVAKNKRKVAFNLKHAAVLEQKVSFSSPLSQKEECMALEHEAMMWKLKRLEVQAHAREMRLALHKQHEETRKKRQELKRLKEVEHELRELLEKCESHSQELSVTSASLVFRFEILDFTTTPK
ncbi:8711_t:CDS:2 [Ambispora leptoticha]|uniref:8711_t:CDS:1 n=1 Tax=Ambispora leptoticha TaxID=144679 RepID=A0A9N8YPP6_9GLOM|nr:8711_t:CDS:2 [Ambispora leptoticha]